ncbi:hypothetical protein HYALB_00013996 [Hymenoscyphus albidus]|uniref:2EXR domain-containing protein n=1 Tax=Hymenoscyphus albidus TaxID=595503 RepID=A0A9N9LVL0_9HELO|nr:hypothetical protein HYALB_00013996 [Hymenoscyphus albidus]
MEHLPSDPGGLEVQNLHKKARESLPNHADVEFPQFPELPFELRGIIWEMACLVLRVHIIKDDRPRYILSKSRHCNRSRIDPIFNTCKEAREVVRSLQLDYFRCIGKGYDIGMDRNGDGRRQRNTSEIFSARNHFMIELDTFWFMSDKDFSSRTRLGLFQDVAWYCGKCNQKQDWIIGQEGCVRWRNLTLHSIAIRLNEWKAPSATGYRVLDQLARLEAIWCSMALAIDCRAKEMLIVVEEFGIFDRKQDLIFLSPDERPRRGILEEKAGDFATKPLDFYRSGENMFQSASKEATWAE